MFTAAVCFAAVRSSAVRAAAFWSALVLSSDVRIADIRSADVRSADVCFAAVMSAAVSAAVVTVVPPRPELGLYNVGLCGYIIKIENLSLRGSCSTQELDRIAPMIANPFRCNSTNR